jgi:hypothetical protein
MLNLSRDSILNRVLRSGTGRLKEFGEELRSVIMSIIPSKTPINLIFDGVADENIEESASTLSGYRLGQVPLEVNTSRF